MKKLVIVCCVFFALSAFYFISSGVGGETSPVKLDFEVTQVVDQFFSATHHGSTADIEELTGTMPEDFYQMLFKCDEKRRIVAMSPIESSANDDFFDEVEKNPSEISTLFINGVSEQRVKSEYKNIFETATFFKKEAFTEYKIMRMQINEKNAIVDIRYGKEKYLGKYLLWQNYFLLNKIDGKWKIFMISGSEIKKDNKYFALSNCSVESIFSKREVKK